MAHIPRIPSVAAVAVVVAAAATAQVPSTSGEIVKIDAAAQRITVKHGGIKNLDMPAMTMVFRVGDARMLDGLQVGQRIGFTAERIGGQTTITSISKAP